MRKKIGSTIFLLVITYILRAQTGLLEGTVTDLENNVPVQGATVTAGNSFSENADQFGRFTIAGLVPGTYELVVTHVGYKTAVLPVEIKAGIRSAVRVLLSRAPLDLAEVKLNGNRSSVLSTLSAVDIRLRPVSNSQDILRIIPGLFIAQHAGGGKAEQLFLRGYDIDHGTDIAITADGIPVNMPSHAHGQGYADLHFLIPETVEKVNFDKGPYNTAKGNLATAAWADFSTRDFLDNNMLKAEGGMYGAARFYSQFRLFDRQTTEKHEQVYLASELARTDGYFENPQDFRRYNTLLKYNRWTGNQSQLTIQASFFSSKWNASGQVPERAVADGTIGRFGAIDPTEGGNTGRTNLMIRYNHLWKNNWKTTDQLYYSHYRFSLFSNFTFFLNDPVNGDMIHQREARDLFGYTTTATKTWYAGKIQATTGFGAGFRTDIVQNNTLAHENRKQFFDFVRKGDIKETNSFAWINQDLLLSPALSLNAGIRLDHFLFSYRDELEAAPAFLSQQKMRVSPKLNLTWSVNKKTKLFLNNGFGFHSNDTRVILDQAATNILPAVFGTDAGILFKPAKGLLIKAAAWQLYSQQEFVYVGDEGIVEPGGRSYRTGLDISARYQFTPWLFGDIDVNYSHARSRDAAKGENYIPLAPVLTSIGGLSVRRPSGMQAALRYRLMGNRPADETNTLTAAGYCILDAVLSWKIKKLECTISAENITNRKWKEAQFETESRLRNESLPVSEIHFTPGTPFFLKAGVSFSF